MDVFEAIKNRRSVRQYKSNNIPDEHLLQMLDAARNAPTAGNEQPWRFLVVRERENLTELRRRLEAWIWQKIEASNSQLDSQAARLGETLKYLNGILAAPLIIFLFVDTRKYPDLVVYDGALAAGNLMLAARALGYGTCFQTTLFPEEIVSDHFDVPEDYRLICVIPVGHPIDWPPAPPKKTLSELIHYEHI